MHVVLNMRSETRVPGCRRCSLWCCCSVCVLLHWVKCQCSVLPGVATTAAIPVLATFVEALPGLAYAVALQQSALFSLTCFAHVAWFC